MSKTTTRKNKKNAIYSVYTDGSCVPDPSGWGGCRDWGAWAAIVVGPGGKIEPLGRAVRGLSACQAERAAVLKGIRSLPPGSRVDLYTDYIHIVNLINAYTAGQKRLTKGWRKDKNPDIHSLCKKYNIKATWVKGHGAGQHPMQHKAHCYARYLIARKDVNKSFTQRFYSSPQQIEAVNSLRAGAIAVC